MKKLLLLFTVLYTLGTSAQHEYKAPKGYSLEIADEMEGLVFEMTNNDKSILVTTLDGYKGEGPTQRLTTSGSGIITDSGKQQVFGKTVYYSSKVSGSKFIVTMSAKSASGNTVFARGFTRNSGSVGQLSYDVGYVLGYLIMQ